MAIIDLFSKRQKIKRGEVPDIYNYDIFPQNLKVQIVHIINDSFGYDWFYGENYRLKLFESIKEILCREYGTFRLLDDNSVDSEVLNHFLTERDAERSLDVVEICFKLIDRHIRNNNQYNHFTNPKINPDEAIKELNERFKENGFGYQYESGEIIRVDSTYVHQEIVKPTIKLLWNKKFLGANDEYLKAHEHYRRGANKECLNECLKAFESTMKIICKEKNWNFNQNDTSKTLINILLNNKLIPDYVQNQFTSLRSLLESGVPTIRNKQGGHGQGQTLKIVGDDITRYTLNLTGSNIIFLIELSGIK